MLIRLQPDEHILIVVVHHIIFDGWSRSNFYRELSDNYQRIAEGQPPSENRLPIQFVDYAAWQDVV